MTWQMARFALADALRPAISRVPRGSSLLYRAMLGEHGSSYRSDAYFRSSLRRRHRVFYDRFVGAFIAVDLADWACRAHYFRGQYYEQEIPVIIDAWLGDRGVFIDVGANRGIHTLYAATRLKERGRVLAFEPNPETLQVLQAHLAINRIENCQVHNVGLADVDGTLRLNVVDEHHSGTCSFLADGSEARGHLVPIRRLDDMVGPIADHERVLVKIDTEGYEYQVLKGMEHLLDHPNLVMVCEVTDSWLRRIGASAAMIFELMARHGYSAFAPHAGFRSRLSGYSRRRLILSPLAAPIDDGRFQYDVVFARGNFST
jgi:FkbM family methyltransferase